MTVKSRVHDCIHHLRLYLRAHAWLLKCSCAPDCTYEYLSVHIEVFKLFLTLYTNTCEWNMRSTMQYLKCSTSSRLCFSGPSRGKAFSSSDLYASTVQHLHGPGLNLFFLMACNCSVDVYFLISSNITGGLVIKHGRVEEKAWVRRGGERRGGESWGGREGSEREGTKTTERKRRT